LHSIAADCSRLQPIAVDSAPVRVTPYQPRRWRQAVSQAWKSRPRARHLGL